MADARQKDEHYMQRAIALAERATGFTSPNPLVGCVLVKDGRIVGEGFHAGPGSVHAEAAALREAGPEAAGATAYVTLEPCNHTGANPPCAQSLIKAQIAEVVYAVADPNPVAAGGAETLQATGIKVRRGLCEAQARHLARFWLSSITARKPYVMAKLAMSLDGRTATASGDSKWITGPEARYRGHDLRQATDAIIVGVETIIADNPSLTARPKSTRRIAQPLRVILDSTGRVPTNATIFKPTTPGTTLVATTSAMSRLVEQQLIQRGVEVMRLPSDDKDNVALPDLMDALHTRNVLSCLVEGGGTVHGAFFDAGLVDEVWAFVAPWLLGGGRSAVNGTGPSMVADAFALDQPVTEQLGPDLLIRGRIVRRDAVSLKEASL